MREDRILDCRGSLCPMPVVKTARAITAARPGDVLKVIVTDRGAIADLAAWTEDTGNELLRWYAEGDHLIFFIRKGES